MDSKLQQLSETMDSRLEQLSIKMDANIDQANKERAAGDAALAAKIDATNASVVELVKAVTAIDARLKSLIWIAKVVGGIVVVLAGGTLSLFATVAKLLHWF
jgi:hypothetical protein